MTLTARPGLAILFVLLAALALSLSGPPAQAQDGSVSDQDEEPDVSYVTVVVDRTPEPSVAQFTVTWNDAHEGECSTQYNAYLVDYFVDTEDVHLGSATSDDVQIVKTVDSSGMDGGLGYRVNLFCGDTVTQMTTVTCPGYVFWEGCRRGPTRRSRHSLGWSSTPGVWNRRSISTSSATLWMMFPQAARG